jgi:hypothetical protein
MGELRFGDCRVVEELGSGSIASVYKATQEPLGRTVAVKALKTTIATNSPFAAHLEREARLLADLSHPNIALLFEFVKTAEQMYLVLEYVEGHSLSKLLAKTPRLRPEVAAGIGAEIARGLSHAHERGVVHRDVKPANVLLSKRGEVKIVDFGIAYRERMPSLDEPLGRAEDAAGFGTPAYMSPEQILGEFVDARSDLFSLGVVLYQMVAGARPFDAEDTHDRRAAAQRIRRDPPKPLRARVPDVPRSFERIVMRLLEKLPGDRYPSAATVTDLLEDFVRGAAGIPARQLISRALVEGGLVKAQPGAGTLADAIVESHETPLGRTTMGFAVLFLALAAGGGAIEGSSSGLRGGSRGANVIRQASARAGALRVVATPWADVAIDGQHVDVTPFARAIPLARGTHYVTLTHPDAPPEQRIVEIAEGQTALLDVTMNLRPTADASAPAVPIAPNASSAKAEAPRGVAPPGERR